MTRQQQVPSQGPDTPWLIDQVLHANETHPCAVIGEPGSGKSFLLVAWALACATGTSWLRYAVVQRNVNVVRPDEGMQDFMHRALAWAQLQPETPPPTNSALASMKSRTASFLSSRSVEREPVSSLELGEK
ncbi:AAA family ATPase [Ktedonobacter sp. SOSP1-52]|uniref:AAA family ATPase n=1 Tax=Ktedonobacter sp. SOSP1-52 TaxID=2778366 RepID=UPI001915C3EF